MSVRTSLMVAAVLLLGTGFAAEPTLSQPRSTFPGRRVGGSTRGECAAREIIHLVPETSVFAPGAAGLIAWLEGPSPDAKPLEVVLREQNASVPVLSRSVAASGPRLVLLRLPQMLTLPLVWESGYQCAEAPAGDEFGFIGDEGPPAKSLLVLDSEPADAAVQTHLKALLTRCDSTTPVASVSSLFDLEHAVSSRWPEVVPVVCM